VTSEHTAEYPVVYCPRHPEVETALECSRCGTPICPRCLVYTPAGTRCPDCAKLRRLPMYEHSPLDLAKALGVSVVLSAALGYASTWLVPIGAFRGLFLLLALFVGSGVGALVAEAIRRVTNGKRGRAMQAIAAGSLVAALVVRIVVSPYGLNVIIHDTAGLLIVGVGIFAAWGRLR
jgi:hypothetical protein